MKKASEYDRFERMTNQIFKVPHSEIKQKLEAEKAAKKRKKPKISSASREANDPA
jgi:hypothetical protein